MLVGYCRQIKYLLPERARKKYIDIFSVGDGTWFISLTRKTDGLMALAIDPKREKRRGLSLAHTRTHIHYYRPVDEMDGQGRWMDMLT